MTCSSNCVSIFNKWERSRSITKRIKCIGRVLAFNLGIFDQVDLIQISIRYFVDFCSIYLIANLNCWFPASTILALLIASDAKDEAEADLLKQLTPILHSADRQLIEIFFPNLRSGQADRNGGENGDWQDDSTQEIGGFLKVIMTKGKWGACRSKVLLRGQSKRTWLQLSINDVQHQNVCVFVTPEGKWLKNDFYATSCRNVCWWSFATSPTFLIYEKMVLFLQSTV